MNIKYLNKKIAVVAAGSVKGEIGGAENFYHGLVTALNAMGCLAELVNMPADESSFDRILENYSRAVALDLSAYDMVISTKAPTYAINHPNHVLYLVHTTRVFYDMFETAFPSPNATQQQQRDTIRRMDTEIITRIPHRFSIGHEVSSRMEKYNEIRTEVLHPPLARDGFFCGESGDFFLMPGRLHPWKRVDLVIRAVKHSMLPLKLVITGTGEAEQALRQLAGDDQRITFLGRVSDVELQQLYSTALAVSFVPVREDYGYVTLEAFASGKPVITCIDSGEPLQFVKHNETGLICEPDAESLCYSLEYLFNNRSVAHRLGLCGLKSVGHITWPNVATRLLSAGFAPSSLNAQTQKRVASKTKVAILDMQPIDPAIGGGRLRLLGLYHALGDEIDARYIGSYDWPGEKFRQHHLTPTLEEIDVPLSDAHHLAASKLAEEAGGKTVIDIAFPRLCHLSPEYLAKVSETIAWADVVIFSHPWVFPLVEAALKPSQLVVYDSHNVEGFLRAQLLSDTNPSEMQLLREVAQAEYAVGCRANLILACSQLDLVLFETIYDWSPSKMRVFPNGVMTSKIIPPTPLMRKLAKTSVGLSDTHSTLLFIGSAYQPNIEAAMFIIHELAPSLPDFHFVIAGGVGSTIFEVPHKNVHITGVVDENEKNTWLHACDAAINPMFSGSGTNIKMFDFMAAGLPVISTKIGARGISAAQDGPISIVDGDAASFVGAIRGLFQSFEAISCKSIEARACVEDAFSWERISPKLGHLLLVASDWTVKSRPFMSLVVPSFARHDKLATLVTSLKKQGDQNLEIVVIDQSSSPWQPSSSDWAGAITYVRSGVIGLHQALNFGASLSNGEVLAFISDDATFSLDCIETAKLFFDDPTVEALAIIRTKDGNAFRPIKTFEQGQVPDLTKGLMVRAEVFHRRGGFLLRAGDSFLNQIRKVAHLSTVGHDCGIGEYTSRLIEELQTYGVSNYVVTCATPNVVPVLTDIHAPSEIGWQYDDKTWSDSVIDNDLPQRLKLWGAETVLVQYHRAFFSGDVLFEFSENCIRLGVDVAILVHNFSNVDLESFIRIKQLGCLIIVHSRREVESAASNGIAVEYLPLFVPRYERASTKSLSARDLLKSPPLIASTGFIRPHKGLPELIEALPIVRRTYPGARLRLQCSLHTAPDSLVEYESCIDQIRRHGLTDAVELEGAFYPIADIHAKVAQADLAVLPYAASSEGGSAAAATVLAAGVPLLLSDSAVFAEVVSAARIMPDTSPQTIAAEICFMLGNEFAYAELVHKGEEYAIKHSASVVTQRLLRLLGALKLNMSGA